MHAPPAFLHSLLSSRLWLNVPVHPSMCCCCQAPDCRCSSAACVALAVPGIDIDILVPTQLDHVCVDIHAERRKPSAHITGDAHLACTSGWMACMPRGCGCEVGSEHQAGCCGEEGQSCRRVCSMSPCARQSQALLVLSIATCRQYGESAGHMHNTQDGAGGSQSDSQQGLVACLAGVM